MEVYYYNKICYWVVYNVKYCMFLGIFYFFCGILFFGMLILFFILLEIKNKILEEVEELFMFKEYKVKREEE